MVFSSHLFLLWFLPAALGLYYLAPRRGRHAALTFVSYVFYGWSNPAFCLLLLISTAIDYVAGLRIAGTPMLGRDPVALLEEGRLRTRRERAWLIVSLTSNLGLLGFFKYFNFGVASYNSLVTAVGLPQAAWETALQVALPLGISFSVFQSMSYTIDVYRGESCALRNFTDFSYYVSMFPQMVAGPIVRFSDIDDQLFERSHTLDKFARGIALFALGFAKKVLLANPMGEVADAVFDAGGLAPHQAWSGVLAYAFQIYFDFSGYSDMAIGLGLMMGFRLCKNFDSPYHADSITNFWQRWHLSLSTWLRDYLYIPLGGNRGGPWATYRNLALTMLLGGLWHGASWNFVIWGAIHGAMLSFERAFGKTPVYQGLPRRLRVVITFVVVNFAWVFFRAPDLPTSARYIWRMLGGGEAGPASQLLNATIYDRYHLLIFAACAVIVWGCRQAWDHVQQLDLLKALALLLLFGWSVAAMFTQTFNPFIYFFF